MAHLNSVRITIIAIIVMVALALGAWTRLTIAMASGAAASRVSTSSPSTTALATTGAAASPPARDAKTVKTVTTRPSKSGTVKSTAHTAKSTTTTSTTTSSSSPEQIAQSMLSSYGWDSSQWTYLFQLWEKESQWSVTATNAGSGAYGIAQANPASQMDSAGSDWRTDASTQIKWGLEYIKDRYGSPEAAWAHETADGWY